MNDRQEIQINNLIAGFELYGYNSFAEPIPGMEDEFISSLIETMKKVEINIEFLKKQYRCRGLSKRLVSLNQTNYPEPSFNVRYEK